MPLHALKEPLVEPLLEPLIEPLEPLMGPLMPLHAAARERGNRFTV